MKTFTRLLPLLTAGTLLATFVTMRAQDAPRDPPEHRGFGDPLQFLTKKLNLSAEQQAQIKPIIEAALPVFKKIHEEERAKMEGAMEVAVSEVKATLNPDQKESLDRILAQMHEHEMHGAPGRSWHPPMDAKPAPAPSATAAP